MRAIQAHAAQTPRHHPRRHPFAMAHHFVAGPRSQSPPRQFPQQIVQRIKPAPDRASTSSSNSRTVIRRVSICRLRSRAAIDSASPCGRVPQSQPRQQLVGHLGHRRHHNHRESPFSAVRAQFRRAQDRFASSTRSRRTSSRRARSGPRRPLLSCVPRSYEHASAALTSHPACQAPRTPRSTPPRPLLRDRVVRRQHKLPVQQVALRSRPTVAAMRSRILSNRGCGRSGLASYSTGCSGALGNLCRQRRKLAHAARICSPARLGPQLDTHATRCAHLPQPRDCSERSPSRPATPPTAGKPSSSLPTSSSSFSPRSLMNGTTLPRMSRTRRRIARAAHRLHRRHKQALDAKRSSRGFSASTSRSRCNSDW